MSTYAASEVIEWTDENERGVGQTALCPRCPFDSVLGDASGIRIDRAFLEAMRSRWVES